MGTIALIILGLVLFICLIITHEMGHFWAARRGGVDIEEFGVFFPPALYKRKTKKGWNFTINLLPLGGFVKLKGEHDSDTSPGSYGAASLSRKTKIMAAGIAVNLVTGYVLFTVLALVGMPHLVSPEVNGVRQFTVASDTQYLQKAKFNIIADTVEKNSPAAKAGIKSGDDILALGPSGHVQKLKADASLSELTTKYAGQTVQVEYDHKGKTLTKTVTLRSDAEVAAAKKQGKPAGHLGISSYLTQDGLTVTRSTWSAPIVAAGVMGQFTGLTFEGLGKALAGLGGIVAGFTTHNTQARQSAQTEASSQVSGPVGVFFVFKYGAELGWRFILMVVAILAMTLGIMNLLPVPALDGGRLWLTLASHAVRRPLSAEREELINAIGFLVLFSLIILVTVADVQRFF